MPKTTKTTVQQAESTGQYQLTIPGQLAEAQGLEGEEVTFEVLSENSLELEIQEKDSDRRTVKVNKDSKGSYRVTLPKAVGDAMKLAGEKVKWQVTGRKTLKLTRTNGDQ